MKNFISKYFKELIIVVLLIILLFTTQKSCNNAVGTVVYDTVTTVKIDTFIKEVVVNKPSYTPKVKYIDAPTDKDFNEVFKPDTAYAVLYEQHKKLAQSYTSTYNYSDTIILDSSLGVVYIKDRVSHNKIQERKFDAKINSKEIVRTVTNNITKTITNPPVRKIFIGGEIGGSQSSPISNVAIGSLYQNRKDNIIGADIGINKIGAVIEPQVSVKAYWKISLRKK